MSSIAYSLPSPVVSGHVVWWGQTLATPMSAERLAAQRSADMSTRTATALLSRCRAYFMVAVARCL
jgi:hypothetical protein